MLRIGGRCGIAVVAAIVAGSAYALPRFGTVNIYELESAEALPRIAQHSRELQVILSDQFVSPKGINRVDFGNFGSGTPVCCLLRTFDLVETGGS